VISLPGIVVRGRRVFWSSL